jgi:hypothetical protein
MPVDAATGIAAGATAKSTSLTLQSASGLGVGSHLMVTQLNDPSYVTITTNNGSCTWCDGGIGWNGTRVQGQIVEVTGVSGNTVTISPALYLAYSRTPLATPVSMGATNAGVENLQVYMNNSGFTANFLMQGASSSWIRNVESNYTDGNHADLHWSYRNEIRDSYFHDAWTHSAGSTDADIFIADKTSGTLVENNALRRLHQSIMLNWGAAGNVIAYNYIDNNFDSGGYNTLFGGLNVHGAHPMFNLWEGNMGLVEPQHRVPQLVQGDGHDLPPVDRSGRGADRSGLLGIAGARGCRPVADHALLQPRRQRDRIGSTDSAVRLDVDGRGEPGPRVLHR